MSAKKDNKDKATVTNLTVRELIGINNAIDSVGELKFPMKIGYQLSKTKGQMETCIKAYEKNVNKLRDELKTTKDGRVIIAEKNMDRWNKETIELIEAKEELELRTFSFTDFDFTDNEDYKETQVPQNFTTLMLPLLTE